MISFIVIGRNEGWKLTNSFKSIRNTITENNISDYEILYIDSQSDDDSVERAKEFKEIVIFKITGVCNAAVARNIGARESKGEVFFFIDGDIELIPKFLAKVIEKNGKLKYDCVSGQVDNMLYDIHGNFLGRSPASYTGTSLPLKEKILKTNGGIFLIKRSCWNKVKGMKTRYRKNQDLDLTLRLKKQGIISIRIPDLMALHHTIDYRDTNRMWKMVFSGDILYPPVLLREHLLNFQKLKHSIRKQYSSFVLLLSLPWLFVNTGLFMMFFIFYLLINATKTFLNVLKIKCPGKSKSVYFFERIGFQMINDILFWLAFIFFYPRDKKMEYVRIN